MTSKTDASTQIANWQALADKATPGPWVCQDYDENPGDQGVPIIGNASTLMSQHLSAYTMTLFDRDQSEADAAFIVAAREAVPRMAAAVQAILGLHAPSPIYAYADDCGCEDEGHAIIDSENGEELCGDSPTGAYYCSECNYEYDGALIGWPCATYRAVTDALGDAA